jgi:glyoxylase-like metal-dependent hydrolase (beta-lactamase superfamily II)
MSFLNLGGIEIGRVVEMDGVPFPADLIFPGIDPAAIARGRGWLDSRFIVPDADQLMWSFHSYVIRSGGRNILIDTCHGNDKQRPEPVDYCHMWQTDYLGNLARQGLRPEDIDIVMCTHLHIDHVGWNTRLENGRWVPTFPNARYLMTRLDYERFEHAQPVDQEGIISYYSFQDSVLPVMEAGLADLIETDHVVEKDLAGGIWLESAAGHTEGSALIHAKNAHGHAIFCGDLLHHPVQAEDLSIHVGGEFDSALGERNRRALMARLCDTDTLLLPAHFPAPYAARVVGAGGGNFRFAFQE